MYTFCMDDGESRYSSSRIESLTDGIFAFAMTLLVLNLSAPVLHGAVNEHELALSLEVMSGPLFSFLLSFFLLATAWSVHHKQFSFIVASDSNLMWINMIRLLFVIMVPFSSVLIGNYPELPISAFIFSVNIFCLCLASYLEWWYAAMHDMVRGVTKSMIHRSNMRGLLPVVVAGVAMMCAPFFPTFSLWLYLLIPLGFMVLKMFVKKI